VIPPFGEQPAVTVSLVTYNGLRWLSGCIDSLVAQTMANFELFVVDNASNDGTAQALDAATDSLATVSIEHAGTNLGFAAAHNRNIYRARGEYVCLLNQDIELDQAFLSRSVGAFEHRPRVGAVQGRVRRLLPGGQRTNVLDSTGLQMSRSRRVIARGQGRADSARWSVPGPVWGADGPVPVYRRAALMQVQEPRTPGGLEVLDEDFFMYKEDVDLAWRLRRHGWSSWYEPSAVAWHARTAGVGDAASLIDVARSNSHIEPWIKAVSWRNQRMMQLKNDNAREIAKDAPAVAGREIAADAFAIIADPGRFQKMELRRSVRHAVRKRRGVSSTATRRGI